jgi:glucose 1-dehydrogenase
VAGRLHDRVCLITGADSGIGRATALLFADEGADVVVNFHSDEQGAEATAAGVRERGRRAITVQADVGDEEDVAAMFARSIRELGPIWALVNNAGVNAAGIPVAEMEVGRFTSTLRTNLVGTFICCGHFIRHRRATGGGGRIVNVTSVHEEIPMHGAADYDAAKGGVRNLTRTLALELADSGVTVNDVAPGMILTAMNQEAIDDPEVKAEAERHIPMRRAGEVGDVASVVLFLASDDAAYVTGATYTVDGGLTVATGQGA